MKSETWVAIYAAIVGTGALLLNFKSWLESGVKLKLRVIPDGMIIGGGPELDEKDLVILTVMNRGDASTEITSMVLLEFTSIYQRWRLRAHKSYAVTNPQHRGYPANLPSDLAPGKRWTGSIRQRPEIIPDLRTGVFYTGVYTTTRDGPYLIRIPKRKDTLLRDAKRID
jgi:hypothetical protein